MRLDTVSVSFVIGFVIFVATGSATAYFVFVPIFTVLLEILISSGPPHRFNAGLNLKNGYSRQSGGR